MSEEMLAQATKRKLSVDQKREYHDAFSMYDTKHKGYISIDQLKALLRSAGHNPTDLQVNRMCWEVDYNGNGKVDFNEFLDLMTMINSEENEETVFLDAFRAFDINNKGYIHAADVREILLRVMDKKSEADKKLIQKVFHLEVDRRISFDDFKQMISINQR